MTVIPYVSGRDFYINVADRIIDFFLSSSCENRSVFCLFDQYGQTNIIYCHLEPLGTKYLKELS